MHGFKHACCGYSCEEASPMSNLLSSNLDTVALLSVLTVVGSILLLAVLALQARRKIFAQQRGRD
ncbi:MAG TPA: hypothetical protein VIS52_06325 [Motiliproteus sp.]